MERELGIDTLEKYKKVIDEWFINGFNGAKAYREIYPKTSQTASAVSFNKIKELKEVIEYVDFKHEEARKAAQTSHEGMLERLRDIICLDGTCTLGLTVKEIKELPLEIRQNIKKVRHSKTNKKVARTKTVTLVHETIEVEFVSKERAIDAINRHIGFYEKDNKQRIATIDSDKLSTDTLKELLDAEIRE